MRLFKSGIFSLLVAALFLLIAAGAQAGTVQLDPAATGAYSITGIENFDWSNTTGSAVIEQGITVTSTGVLGTYTTTLENYFAAGNSANRVNGDILDMEVHAQTQLTGMTGTNFSDSSGLTLDIDGVGGNSGNYEITMVTSFAERAYYVGNVVDLGAPGNDGSGYLITDTLVFTDAQGEFEFYLDNTTTGAPPNTDSDPTDGSGFTEGSAYNPFLSGTVDGSEDSYTTVTTTDDAFTVLTQDSSGSNTLFCSVEDYDVLVIDTDPSGGDLEIVGTDFTTQLKLSTDPSVTFLGLQDGGHIGMDGNDADSLGDFVYDEDEPNGLLLYADSGSNFNTGTTIPEPGTMILFGVGLLGVAGMSRRRKS